VEAFLSGRIVAGSDRLHAQALVVAQGGYAALSA
jgi:hypothetical protein